MIFQGFIEIQNGHHRSILIFWRAHILTITFLATWGCASDFVKMLQKFKMAARGQLQNFLWAQKLIQILLYHIPHDMEMCR